MIGKYQPNHTWNLRRICYRFHIPRQNIGVIPYNLELEEAVTYGRVLQFLNRNIDEKQNNLFVGRGEHSTPMADPKIYIPYNEHIEIGEFYKIKISGVRGKDMNGILIN